jgi:two-component sensor histidine kinase
MQCDPKRAAIWATPRSVRTYLVLFALSLVLPLLLISIFALQRMAAVEEADTSRRILQIARNTSVSVDQELDRALVTLKTLATSSELRAGNFHGFHDQAVRAPKPTKAAIVLIDRAYRQLVDTLKEYGATLPPTADPETAQLVIDTGQPQISNLFRGSVNGLPVFNVEVPFFGEGQEVQYVLIMSFQAAHVSDLLEQLHLSPGWTAGITDRTGTVLARSERATDYVGTRLPPDLFEKTKSGDGVYRAISVEGDAILQATARSARSGWYVSASVPIELVKEPYMRGYLFAALLLGIALALSWIFAYLFARLMALPLDAALRAAAAVGRGEDVRAGVTALTEANLLLATLSEASRELRLRADHAAFLMRELAHRAKNQLAVVRGMALQTAQGSKGVNDFVSQFNQRIQGLAQSQDILVRENWRGGQLCELVSAHLDLFGTCDRVTANGPPVFLDAAGVQNVGFALHELATNASKHGAFSTPSGRVSVNWTAADHGGVHICWIEEGGPVAQVPEQHGFGVRVITELVPRSLNGTASLTFTPTGLRWKLAIPQQHVVSSEAQRSS